MDIPELSFVSIYLLMDILVISSFWLLQIKLLETFVYKPLNKGFHFSWVNPGIIMPRSHGRCMFNFLGD